MAIIYLLVCSRISIIHKKFRGTPSTIWQHTWWHSLKSYLHLYPAATRLLYNWWGTYTCGKPSSGNSGLTRRFCGTKWLWPLSSTSLLYSSSTPLITRWELLDYTLLSLFLSRIIKIMKWKLTLLCGNLHYTILKYLNWITLSRLLIYT